MGNDEDKEEEKEEEKTASLIPAVFIKRPLHTDRLPPDGLGLKGLHNKGVMFLYKVPLDPPISNCSLSREDLLQVVISTVTK
jgi:hypothetical protein